MTPGDDSEMAAAPVVLSIMKMTFCADGTYRLVVSVYVPAGVVPTKTLTTLVAPLRVNVTNEYWLFTKLPGANVPTG